MNAIKDYLLSFEIFIQNEEFDKYITLLESNKDRKYVINSTQKHHIIPKSYFSINDEVVDDSEQNIVNLQYSDHILAHYYLSKCTISPYYQPNIRAVIFMCNNPSLNCEADLFKVLPEYQKLYEQYRRVVSASMNGRVVTDETRNKISCSNRQRYVGDIAIHKGDIDKHVKQEELQYYIDLGYQIGRSQKFIKALSDGYNYQSKGMLGKHQSDKQKQAASIASSYKRTSEQRSRFSESKKRPNTYTCLRNPSNTSTIRCRNENVQKYIDLGYTLCK